MQSVSIILHRWTKPGFSQRGNQMPTSLRHACKKFHLPKQRAIVCSRVLGVQILRLDLMHPSHFCESRINRTLQTRCGIVKPFQTFQLPSAKCLTLLPAISRLSISPKTGHLGPDNLGLWGLRRGPAQSHRLVAEELCRPLPTYIRTADHGDFRMLSSLLSLASMVLRMYSRTNATQFFC